MRHGPYLGSVRWFSVGLALLMAVVPLACGGTKALESGTVGAAGSNAGSVAGSGGGTGSAAGSNAGSVAGSGGTNPACSAEQSVAPVPGIAVYEKNTCVGTASKLVCSIPDLMPRLLACDAVSFTFTPESSLSYDVFRVAERRQDTCVVELWEDYEANESYWICELPLPLVPWKGLLSEHGGNYSRGEALLDGIKDHCSKVATCCIFTPYCSPAHCDPGYRSFGC